VLLLNVGPTRADPLIGTAGGIEKLEIPAGAIIRDVVRGVLYVLFLHEHQFEIDED
jgi:NAD-dependent deacetylase sirtuin 4